MEQSDGEISHVDPAVFYWKDKERNVKGILACHVDDFLWAGSQEFENSVVNGIRSTFQLDVKLVMRMEHSHTLALSYQTSEVSFCFLRKHTSRT